MKTLLVFERSLSGLLTRFLIYSRIMLALEPGGQGGAKKGVPDIYLQVDNVVEAYRELKGRSVTFLSEPKDQGWGARSAKFEDLDGSAFILVQPKK